MYYRISFCILTLFITSCFSNHGIVSIDDKNYFSEPPKIVTTDSRYFLRFVYSDANNIAMYSMTNSKIVGSKLIFFIPVITSTGNAMGKLQYEEIVDDKKIRLIKKGSVYWENPDKKLVPLKIEVLKEKIDVINNKSFQH